MNVFGRIADALSGFFWRCDSQLVFGWLWGRRYLLLHEISPAPLHFFFSLLLHDRGRAAGAAFSSRPLYTSLFFFSFASLREIVCGRIADGDVSSQISLHDRGKAADADSSSSRH